MDEATTQNLIIPQSLKYTYQSYHQDEGEESDESQSDQENSTLAPNISPLSLNQVIEHYPSTFKMTGYYTLTILLGLHLLQEPLNFKFIFDMHKRAFAELLSGFAGTHINEITINIICFILTSINLKNTMVFFSPSRQACKLLRLKKNIKGEIVCCAENNHSLTPSKLSATSRLVKKCITIIIPTLAMIIKFPISASASWLPLYDSLNHRNLTLNYSLGSCLILARTTFYFSFNASETYQATRKHWEINNSTYAKLYRHNKLSLLVASIKAIVITFSQATIFVYVAKAFAQRVIPEYLLLTEIVTFFAAAYIAFTTHTHPIFNDYLPHHSQNINVYTPLIATQTERKSYTLSATLLPLLTSSLFTFPLTLSIQHAFLTAYKKTSIYSSWESYIVNSLTLLTVSSIFLFLFAIDWQNNCKRSSETYSSSRNKISAMTKLIAFADNLITHIAHGLLLLISIFEVCTDHTRMGSHRAILLAIWQASLFGMLNGPLFQAHLEKNYTKHWPSARRFLSRHREISPIIEHGKSVTLQR